MENLFIIEPTVAKALESNLPVVALESTIITHGMPYPQNLETAQSLEAIVKENNCTPATIAIIKGKIHIGLSPEELSNFAQLKHHEVKKASTRDLPILIAQKANGSTTVAATSFIASKVGIKFFATGGIGGVHRGVTQTLDISNDLVTMAKTPICVVSAGVKSILDIPKTLELLETLGVPVVTWKSEKFPAFFIRDSGVKSPASESDLETLAEIARTHFDILKMKRTLFVANPISESDQCEFEVVQQAIDDALKEKEEKNILGRDITPFILQRVNELTKGKSLAANIKLVRSNARLASRLAFQYHQAQKK